MKKELQQLHNKINALKIRRLKVLSIIPSQHQTDEDRLDLLLNIALLVTGGLLTGPLGFTGWVILAFNAGQIGIKFVKIYESFQKSKTAQNKILEIDTCINSTLKKINSKEYLPLGDKSLTLSDVLSSEFDEKMTNLIWTERPYPRIAPPRPSGAT